MLEHHDPVGEDERVEGVVRHQDRRAGELREVRAQVGAYVDPGRGVERGERLVEQEDARPARQGARERGPLLLPAGELVGGTRGQRLEPEPRDPLGGVRPRPGLRAAGRAEAERDVVEDGEVREQPVLLEHDTDLTPRGRDEQVGGGVVDDHVVEPQAAAGQRSEAADRPQQSGFPGPVRTEDSHHLAGPHVDLDVEPELAALDHHVPAHAGGGRRAHDAAPVRSHRSLSATRTRTDTASSTRLSATASDGSPSRPT